MPTVRVVADDGTIHAKELDSKGVTLDTDDGTIEPAVVERIEYDHKGGMSKITTVCGETENRRESDEKPDITIEGIVTETHKDDIKYINEGQNLTLISDLDTGDVIVDRVVIEQTTDIVEFLDNSGNPKLAFPFQLQLKYPE